MIKKTLPFLLAAALGLSASAMVQAAGTAPKSKSVPFAFPEGLSMDIRNVAPLTRILDSFLASGIKTAVDGGTSISR